MVANVFLLFRRRLCRIGLLAVIAACHAGTLQADEPVAREALWQRLEKFDHPPAEFAGRFGPYRSPLKFADGTLVRSPADWVRRRTRILETWQRPARPLAATC